MAIDTYMVITDQNNATLVGESPVTVTDPYLKRNVQNPVQLQDFSAEFENSSTLGTGGGGGAGKITFDPLTVSKTVDKISQTLFLADAMGTTLKFVDLLLVRSVGDGSDVLRPFLSLRLGTVLVSDLKYNDDEESPRENVTFVFGQFQIGYQAQKPDGTYLPFLPVGWDRIRNVRI